MEQLLRLCADRIGSPLVVQLNRKSEQCAETLEPWLRLLTTLVLRRGELLRQLFNIVNLILPKFCPNRTLS
jgi:hypothetical protein